MLQKCQENDLDHASNPSVLGIQNSCTNFFIMASEKLCMFYAVKKDFADYCQCCQPLWFIIFGLLEFADIKMSTFMSSHFRNFDSGNLAIFVPIWFYVKSILSGFRWLKTAVLTILRLCFFRNNSHLKVSKVPKNSKFRVAQMLKIAYFGASKLTIDFT